MRPRPRFVRTIALSITLFASGVLTASSRAEDNRPKDNCDLGIKKPFQPGPMGPCLPPPPPLPGHPHDPH